MPQQNNIYTVKELNERIQELVSGESWLGSLGVEGEITGLGTDKRGHMYFSLKDPSGVLAAVMFAGKQYMDSSLLRRTETRFMHLVILMSS